MFGMGAQELIIIFAIVFFIFGAKRLPEMGKGIGQALRGFKTAIAEKPQIAESQEINESMTKK
jgi:sec-independent protein translocase protein TatA